MRTNWGSAITSLVQRLCEPWIAQYPRLYDRLLACGGENSWEKRVFLHTVRPGDTVFDIGANRGHFTLLFAQLVGESGIVHAFEPLPDTFRQLEKAVSSRRSSAIRLNNVGLSREAALEQFFVPGADDGQASLRVHQSGSWASSPPVKAFACRTMRLDDYVKDVNLARLDFMKIDVEGAESFVLEGAEKTVQQFRPMLFLEVCPDWLINFSLTAAAIGQQVWDLGYRDFFMHRDDRLFRLSASATRDSIFPQGMTGWANLLCVDRARHSERMRSLAIVAQTLQ